MMNPVRGTTATIALLALGLMLAIGACSHQQESPGGSAQDSAGQIVPTPDAPVSDLRPQTKEGTIQIEGIAQPIRLELFDAAPYSMPLLFTTYIPSDMIAKQVPDAEGPAVRFVSNFDEKRNPDAFLQIGFLPPGTTANRARAAAQALATGSGRKARASQGKSHDWSLAEHTYTAANGALGRIALAGHRDRFYHIRSEYPAEFGDGFGPRMAIIFDEWKWSDAIETGMGAGAQNIDAAADTASVVGTILRIDEGEGSQLGTLFLEQSAIADTASNKAVVMVARSTRLFRQEGSSRREASFADLKRGTTIRATFSGPILMIYPMRVTADEVVIVAE